MKSKCNILAIFFSMTGHASESLSGAKPTHVVTVPVTNLVSRPVEYCFPAPAGAKDTPYLMAQLLYDEGVIVLDSKDGWSRVRVLQLFICPSRGSCQPLQGWLKSEHLRPQEAEELRTLVCVVPWTPVYTRTRNSPHSFKREKLAFSYGTKLKGIKKEDQWWHIQLVTGEEAWIPAPCVEVIGSLSVAEKRVKIVSHALQFKGGPYVWGGCSAPNPSETDLLVGCDCSGLVYLLYLAAGVLIPRNSRSQYYRATPCDPSKAQPGDLIFLVVPRKSPHVSHVMLYLGDDMLIEAWCSRAPNGTMNVQPIHIISVEERLGKPLREITNGERVGRYRCYTGTFLGD